MVDACNNGNTASPGNPNGYHTGYTNLGLLAPDFTGAPSGTRPLYTYNCDISICDSGAAAADAIIMPSPQYISSAEQCIRSIVGHELFHHVESAYQPLNKVTSQWAMPRDGIARMLQDKIYTDLDAYNGSGCAGSYIGEVNGFLANPNRDIWTLTYPSALFWTYLSEQLGTTTAEPVAGADFVHAFWERAQANINSPDVVKTTREAISHYDNNETLEERFQDFTITNLVHDWNLSALSSPDVYRYRDENDGNGITYQSVPQGYKGDMPPALTGSSSVVRWGARYLMAGVAACPNGVVGFRSTGDRAAYALVALKGAGQVQGIYETTGSTFARTLVQRSTSSYTYLAAVVTGLNDAANFTYTFDCGTASLSIREPRSPDAIAYVGSFSDPERFLVKLRVQGPASLGSPSVEGLEASDFKVYVQGAVTDDQAQVLGGAYVQGEYWLLAQAPTKSPGGPVAYNMFVMFGNVAAVSEAAVRYETKSVDQVLVIDKSGSMTEPSESPKVEAAKMGAMLFVDSARSTDQNAVVSFSGNDSETDDDAVLEDQLRLANPGNRLVAKFKIALISPYWLTSIGDGMNKAYNELVNSGRGRPSPPTERWIVLLSDGMENEAAFWADLRNTIKNNGIKVNAIALGPTSDQPLMQSIASDTQGRFYYVDLPPGGASQLSIDAPQALSALSLRLADAYALSAERIQGHERLWEQDGNLAAGEYQELHTEVNEEGIEDALFTVAWSGGEMSELSLFDPEGSLVEDGVGGAVVTLEGSYATFRVPWLIPGEWHINLQAGEADLEYLVILSGKKNQGAQLRLFFGAYGGLHDGLQTNQFLISQPMPILASLTDLAGPIREARVVAAVEHPDGSILELTLYDDGNHNDELPGDGIYGGLYTRTTVGSKTHQEDEVYQQRGSYNVTLTAYGDDNFGRTFNRIARGSFNILDPIEHTGGTGDSDSDGLTDLYEKLHPCLNYLVYDSHLDQDFDYINTLTEYQSHGTDPCNPDTDNGGENDASEIEQGRNPHFAGDDAVPAPIDVGVVSQVSNDLRPLPDLRPNANLIRYPGNPAYETILLFRSTNPNGPFSLARAFESLAFDGLYHDEGLVNDVTYYYRIMGMGWNGELSASSHVFSGTPRSDPFPPIGGILINNHAAYVGSPDVTLYLPVDIPSESQSEQRAEYDASEMMISNNPLFIHTYWQPYEPEIVWTLDPDPISGYAIVYVKFRDAAGNVSETVHADVIYKPSTWLGKIHIHIHLITAFPWGGTEHPELAGEGGTLVMVKDDNVQPPAYSDENGDAVLEGLPPGSYALLVMRGGYRTIIVNDVHVSEGQETNLGEVDLYPMMLLMPIIKN